MHACPAPGCKHIIHAVTGIKDKDVQCPCGALVCSACGFLHGHAPASCDFVTIYEDVMDPERRTKEFLAVAVKDCPKCKVPVEKVRRFFLNFEQLGIFNIEYQKKPHDLFFLLLEQAL
jgi:hypothetical protein